MFPAKKKRETDRRFGVFGIAYEILMFAFLIGRVGYLRPAVTMEMAGGIYLPPARPKCSL